jgi:SAM-dependent methyltransferase
MHWLRTMLRFKPPPARVLEIGCAHGGFVALLRWAGYDALGLELSPFVVDFARKTFDITVLLGPIEQQSLPEKSLDAIVLNDVVEHLSDPLATLSCCARLLKDDGVFVVQMPDYPNKSYEELRARDDYFLHHVDGKEKQHLHLFSRRAARRLLGELGFTSLMFEPAMFEIYDMYFVAGRQPLVRRDREVLAQQMLATPAGRVSLAWIDLLFDSEEREADRAQRLAIIRQLEAKIQQRWPQRLQHSLRRLFRAA